MPGLKYLHSDHPLPSRKVKRPDCPREKQTLNKIIFYKNHSHHLHLHCWGAHFIDYSMDKKQKSTRNNNKLSTQAHRLLNGANKGSPSAAGSSEVPAASGSPTSTNQSNCPKGQQIHILGLESQRPIVSFIIQKDIHKSKRKHSTNGSELPLGILYLCLYREKIRMNFATVRDMYTGLPGQDACSDHFLPSCTLLCHLCCIS